MTQIEERLEKAGFTQAGKRIKELRERKRKLMLAYKNYRFVRQENVDNFNTALKKKTITGKEPYNATWQKLDFVSIASYAEAPPEYVIKDLELAIERKCFDSFEVAYIRDAKDPILFGRIGLCPDRFFIAQWDEDVKITDLLKDNEG
jgi:hypothetical protein